MGLFKRKPGGTFVGNLLRGIGVNPTPVPPYQPNVPSSVPAAAPAPASDAPKAATTGIMDKVKANPMLSGIAVLVVGVLVFFGFKPKSGSRSRRKY